MKKYLLTLFCIFISFSSFAQDKEPSETFKQWKERTGLGHEQFIDLLEHPPMSLDERIFSWVDELLEENTPDIDRRLIRLLLTDRWVNSSDEEDIHKWMATLIRREFANDQEITAIFEEEPWKSHFVSSIAKGTFNHMIDKGRNFRTAAEHASIDFFTRRTKDRYWDLGSQPKLFTWTITIWKKWENRVGRQNNNFHERIANAFANNTADMRKSWKDFEDFDRLTEFLLTQGTSRSSQSTSRSSAFAILRRLPTNTDVHMPNRILVAAKNISVPLTFELIPLLNKHLTSRRSSPNVPHLNDNDIKAILDTIDSWLFYSRHDQFKYSIDALIHTIDLLAKDIDIDDPRIQSNIGHILQSDKILSFSEAVSLLETPGWRTHPEAPRLLLELIQKPLYNHVQDYAFHLSLYSSSDWNREKVEKLLADPFWQNHPMFKDRLNMRADRNLEATGIILLLHDHGWRELPPAPNILIKVLQQLNKGEHYNDWEEEEINKLLKDSFWQEKLRQRWWQRLLAFKTITLNDIKRYACPAALTKRK